MAEVEEVAVGFLEEDKQESHVSSTFSDWVGQPLLQTATDGADPGTSVPLELELASGDGPGCSGSVRSLCSDSDSSSGQSRSRSRDECPICSEPAGPGGDLRLARLHCNHVLCHRCLDNILRRARSPGSVRCPFCRQTTPFPQLEIQRLQEESYSLFIQESPDVPAPSSLDPSAQEAWGQPAVPGCLVYLCCLVRGLRFIWKHCVCFSVLLLLLLLGCLCYIDISLLIYGLLNE